MSSVNLAAIQHMTDILGEHDRLAYVALFLGSFLETLIPVSLFVLGELFFITGALLAGMEVLNVWLVLTVLYAGGILGDNASYWLGRKFGEPLFELMVRMPLVGRLAHYENYQRGVKFFERRGAVAIFAARLSGPLSWVMPAMAGMFRLNYTTFIRFNTPAVILGIGQFIVVGYFFGAYLPTIVEYAERYGTTIFSLLLVSLGLAAWYWWAKRRAQSVSEQ
jgi:membrane-associated protein